MSVPRRLLLRRDALPPAHRWFILHVLENSISQEADGLALFVLQVLGGAGAWWGVSEIAGLRVNYPADCHGSKYDGVDGAWVRRACPLLLPVLQLRTPLLYPKPSDLSMCAHTTPCLCVPA